MPTILLLLGLIGAPKPASLLDELYDEENRGRPTAFGGASINSNLYSLIETIKPDHIEPQISPNDI